MEPTFTPVIILHVVAALAALVLGSLVFLRRKGGVWHRRLGRSWVLLMVLTAGSSFWIKGGGQFSWLHGLSLFTLLSLGLGIYYAATGRVQRHRKTMIGLFAGSLVVAGLFTLLPQRLLGHTLWSALGLL